MKRPVAAIAVFLLALIPSLYMAWQSRDMPHLGHYHDDSVYWVCAKALAGGAGYRILSLPNQPYQTKYPPLYPALLATVWSVQPSFPANLRLAVVLAWLMLPLYVLMARLTFRDLGLSPGESWMLCTALAINPSVVFLSANLMPDLLFSALLLASLALAAKAGRGSGSLALAAGLVGAAAYLTRSAAAPLLLTAPLWFLLRRQFARAGLFFAGMAPAVACWTWWVRSHLFASSDPVSLYYTNYLGYQLYNVSWQDLPLFLRNNLYFLLAGISKLIVYDAAESFWGGHFWRLFAYASIAGTIRLLRTQGLTQLHLFALGFVPLLLVWHFPPDERLILPVFPLLLAGLYVELRHVVGMVQQALHSGKRASRCVAGLFAAGLGAFALAGLFLTCDALVRFLPAVVARHRRQLANETPGYQWVAQNVPKDGAFLAYDDPIFYLYTGRPALSIPVPPKVFYRQGRRGVERLFASLSDFARQYRLTGLWSTPGDFYRGELTDEERDAVWRSVEASGAFRRVYQSRQASVHLLVDPGSVLPPGRDLRGPL